MRFCYWLNHYIKSSANHSSHTITAVKPRSEAKSITHQFILIHNSEQQKQTVPVYMTLQVEIQLQNIQNWIHCNKIYQHCSYVFIVYSSTRCLLVDLHTFSHIFTINTVWQDCGCLTILTTNYNTVNTCVCPELIRCFINQTVISDKYKSIKQTLQPL